MSTGNGILGIRREDKNKWERRVPLAPDQVKTLVSQGIKVIIQPSNIRIYPDDAYAEAGALVQEDISSASVILAVKEVPIHLLLSDKTYLFFSHTIKAQPANMPLLDELLAKRIRMVDYECITVGGLRGAKRLVAFGKFAGIAGMIDFFRGMGERLLALGFSTPFLGIAATYMYPSLEAAYAAVRACGEAIARYGLPKDLGALTFVFTGDGNVSQGAQEVFNQLGEAAHWIKPEELGHYKGAKGKEATHRLRACVVKEEHMVKRKDSSQAFNKAEYRVDPDLYEPIFHETVIPHTSILINSMYWDQKFPRLLTTKQAQDLKKEGRLPLLGVCDITCDFQGSVEFLKEFTSIEKPFYIFDVEQDAVVHDMDAAGILYHAVDHLPSECPLDASRHFGSCLLPFIPALVNSDGTRPFEDQSDIPVEIKGAVLCAHGKLTPNFAYIAQLRAAAQRAETGRAQRSTKKDMFVTLDFIGHLFDTGFINLILDKVEELGGSARILDFKVGKDRTTPTELRVQLLAHDSAKDHVEAEKLLADLVEAVGDLAEEKGITMHTEGIDSYIHSIVATRKNVPRSVMIPAKNILVLGAGFVSGPLVEYLLRFPGNHLTVASMIPSEAESLARGKPRTVPVQLDVGRDRVRLEQLVSSHDLIVSLVPAPCHPPIAALAISHKKHMVTASYVSPEMRALDAQAKAAGITILNEAGLDPGIDHMSAMEMIDSAKDRGGVIVGFSSVCGGLPAPEAANNPLGYKFSWSPRGALSAARNTARHLRDGKVVEVPGEALLTSAAPFKVNPAFNLEVIPNRDSLPYADRYGIAGPHLKTMFRGTLRYRGFCASLSAIVALGFLEVDAKPAVKGVSLRALLAAAADAKPESSDDEIFAAVVGKVSGAAVTQIDRYTEFLAKLSPSLAEGARAAAAECSNSSLAADSLRQEALRGFLEWAGFFSTEMAPLRGADSGNGVDYQVEKEVKEGRMQAGEATTHCPLDTLVAVLTSKSEMFFVQGERDMALMQHELEVELPDGTREIHTATLIEYADLAKKQTAMARTVGLTAAIGAQLILDGTVLTTGVVEPVTKEWYAPMISALSEEGIVMKETKKVIPALSSNAN